MSKIKYSKAFRSLYNNIVNLNEEFYYFPEPMSEQQYIIRLHKILFDYSIKGKEKKCQYKTKS